MEFEAKETVTCRGPIRLAVNSQGELPLALPCSIDRLLCPGHADALCTPERGYALALLCPPPPPRTTGCKQRTSLTVPVRATRWLVLGREVAALLVHRDLGWEALRLDTSTLRPVTAAPRSLSWVQLCAMTGPAILSLDTTNYTEIAFDQQDDPSHTIGPTNPKLVWSRTNTWDHYDFQI